MSSLKDQTITSTYDQLIKRQDTYSATNSRLEVMTDSAVVANTALYLDMTNQRLGVGVSGPQATLSVGSVNTLLTDATTAVGTTGANIHINESSKYAAGIINANAS